MPQGAQALEGSPLPVMRGAPGSYPPFAPAREETIEVEAGVGSAPKFRRLKASEAKMAGSAPALKRGRKRAPRPRPRQGGAPRATQSRQRQRRA